MAPAAKLDVVRGIFEAWSRGDFRAAERLFDPHVLLILRPEFPESGVYHGPGEIASYTRGLLASWEHFSIEAEEFAAAGDSVVVGVKQRGVGRASGLVTELRYFQVFTFRNDSIIRIESIGDREEALAVVGLRG